MKTIALIGQPNVGKSCFFNHLTGVNAIVSNYPGTTVELMEGVTFFQSQKIRVVDLPGTYALGEASEDERVAKDYLLEKKPDAVINIIDCTILERSLYLTLQLIELGIPFVIALNFHEEAKKKGIEIFASKLEKKINMPVVSVNAFTGRGIYKAVEKALGVKEKPKLAEYKKMEKHIGSNTEIAMQRHKEAALLARECSRIKKGAIQISGSERMDAVITNPLLGTIITAIILLSMLFIIFFIGGFLEELVALPFEEIILPWMRSGLIFLPPLLFKILEYSVIGVEAGLAIAIPYIGLFYLMLALLEDSGYLSRLAYLSDNVMHTIGLHGKATIPLLLGFGCNVPSIKAVKILSSPRERLIAAILVVFVPCSAVTAVILGATGYYIGFQYALLIYAIVFALIFSVGIILNKILPGRQTGLIIEMPNYRIPSARNVITKTWLRMKDFVYMAFPLLIIGSAFLGLLVAANLLPILIAPLRPIISGWLMLPDTAGISLIYGILRKEMALETLAVLAGTINLLEFMTPLQIFTFSLVTAIYIPCLATIVVLWKEFGIKKALIVSVASIALAFLIGGITTRILLFFNLLA